MQKVLRAIGIVVVCISLFFIFEKIWANRVWLLEGQFTKQVVMAMAIGSVVYALSLFLLSSAWRIFLIWFGQPRKTIKNCHAIYARTQIAKYIPGNIFHLAGRHVMGKRVGFQHGPLTGAAVYEIAGLLVASSAIALLGIVFYGIEQLKLSALGLLAIFITTLFAPLALNKIILKFPKLRGFHFQDKTVKDAITDLVPAYLLYVVFFVITGGILLGVAYAVSDIENIQRAGFVIITFAVSWIAGYITPGASGGIGIREAIMVLSFTSYMGEAQSIFIALIFRIITLSGDFLFFLSSFTRKISYE